ncbi:O-methyltransferase [Treponema sp. C6A8]|uniref:O-methyltransferase n=1 Tax=Treponema sp. C6A8 TaxID=1410609 RepID=UPI0004808F36|nr:class I SAM-dependent methyltransferase [Treponema sp. C6A8]
MQQINEIKDFADMHSVPIMKDEGISFICDYIKEHNVKRVLEIGTAIGFSSINFARAGEEVFVSTIEMDLERYQAAVKNIADNGLSDRINCYLGDAGTWTPPQGEVYDLIFIDGPKAQYINHFERFKDSLAPDGVIITDNLSFHGMVEDLSLTHNYSTIKMMRKIRKFIKFLRENKEFSTTFYDLGDRISVSKR